MVERLTREETRALVGPADDATLTAIIEMGLTRAELAEARAWIDNDEAMLNDGRSPSGRVLRAVELLREQEEADDLASEPDR
jgi:hypothetical protein